MGMRLDEIRGEVAAFAASFDPSIISPVDADRIVRDATAIENVAATIKSLAAHRAAEGGQWRRAGARSAAHDLARKTGTTVGKAREALGTGEKLAELPALNAAARAGELSPAQTAPIAEAASKDPSATQRLVDKAKRASVGELRDECDRIKAAAEPDDDARHRAIHRARSLRSFGCADGAGELRYRSTRDEVAEILSVIRGYANREFDLARLQGRHEPEVAYLADGLLAACRAAAHAATGPTSTNTSAADGANPGDGRPVEAASSAASHPHPGERTGGSTSNSAASNGAHTTDAATTGRTAAKRGRVRKATPTKIIVRIDFDALVRGWPIDGEVCEIAGLGAIPVSAVRTMMASGDAFLAGVVTKGVDVATVVHLGRKPTAYQGTALDWLSPTCTTEGCNNNVRLETDHLHDWAKTKITLLRWLERHCEHCHDNKTRHGWALVRGHGKRPMVPPNDPKHPRYRDAQPPPLEDTG